MLGLVLGSCKNLQLPFWKFRQSAPNLQGLGPPYIDILIMLNQES